MTIFDEVPQHEIKQQLEHMLRMSRFIRADSQMRLLKFLVEAAPRDVAPSEIEIGIKFFGMSSGWVREDITNVRVALSRLTERLRQYYLNEGKFDPIIIQITRRKAIAQYNRFPRVTRPSFDTSPNAHFLEARDAFFTSPFESAPGCVVTGEAADIIWHHLDGDSYNPSLGNQIPLAARLCRKIAAFPRRRGILIIPELEPARLGDKLAPEHFRESRPARAYGCAALAFYLGASPHGQTPDHIRAQWVCDVITYVRRHFLAPLMDHVLCHMVLPFLTRHDDIDASAALRLTVQLTALLEETGHYEDAETCLSFGNHISRVVGKSFFANGSSESFGLLRRRAQLLAERFPNDVRFEELITKAHEHAADVPERIFDLHIVRMHRWLRQGSPEGLRSAHEALRAIVESHQPGAGKIRERITAHLGELFLLSAIAACRLRPARWKSYAEEAIDSAKTLIHRSGHVLPAEYRVFTSTTARKHNASSAPLLRLTPAEIRPSELSSANASLVLKCLARLHLLHVKTQAPR